FPRRLLRLLVVLLKSALHVAKLAIHSQRRRNELHRRNQLIRWNALKHLHILKLLLSLLRPGSRSLRTSARLRPRKAHPDNAGSQNCKHPQNVRNFLLHRFKPHSDSSVLERCQTKFVVVIPSVPVIPGVFIIPSVFVIPSEVRNPLLAATIPAF